MNELFRLVAELISDPLDVKRRVFLEPFDCDRFEREFDPGLDLSFAGNKQYGSFCV